jgi:hypothetical protein
VSFLGFRPIPVYLCGEAVEHCGAAMLFGGSPVSGDIAVVADGRLFMHLCHALVDACCLVVSSRC